MSRFVEVVRRDLRLALRQGSDSVMVVTFFILTVILFPFGLGPETNLLERVSPGVLMVTALLASMLSLDRLFQADYEDGSLELLAMSPMPLELAVAAKMLAHWLTTGLPLIVVAPVLAVLLHLPAEGFAPLLAAMALGTPVLSLIGGIGAALVLGARRGGVLLSLLILPLYIPVLIFSVGAIDAAIQGLEAGPHLLILGGVLIAALALSPWVAAAALRQAVE
ncbi:heme exporter protein CcmB [Magnetospirillum fulvum]|uniref:Heme exporter protein B n=1 Tax=Magnetospirillum fulvum TaxID=1082 RepID=A0A1H6GZM7_MAGFU|nr:heme exporter protein CcmB [Magnetospirillum fulvum]SEH27345.1 heme exporter protein B [Magnetospirillum fulvum]